MKRDRNRSGIALIVVLGFLAIMLVMGLAFSVSMRTERLASEVSRDAMQVSQLLRAGLADAMDELNMVYFGSGSTAPQYYALRNQDAIIESQANATPQITLSSGIGLCSGEALEWIPAKFLNAPPADFNVVSKADNAAQWIFLRDTTPGENNRILGRYGYVILDCTGQLDANIVDDSSVRNDGTNYTRELRISSLPEVNNVANFRNNRNFFDRFGTFSEIMLLNDGSQPSSYGAGTWYSEEQPAFNSTLLNNFCSYSWCYDRGWWDPGTASWQTYWDAKNLSVANFQAAGFSPMMAANLVNALVDFQDPDSNPANNPATAPSFEAVPMINEVIVTNRVSLVAGTLTHTIGVGVEIYYPFPENSDNNSYVVRLFSMGTMEGGTAAGSGLLPSAFMQVSPAYSPATHGQIAWRDIPIPPVGVAVNPANWSYRARLDNLVVQVVRSSSGTVVDQVNPPHASCRLSAGNTSSAFPVEGSSQPDSVLDPRANHNPANWIQNQLSKNDLNSNLGPNFNLSQNGMYEGLDCYVKNAALESVDELGYLFTGVPWTSIDLFGEQGVELLRKAYVFETTPVPITHYTNGLINPNSHFGEVLRIVFEDVPMDPVPRSSATPTTNILADVSMHSYLTNAIMSISSQDPWDNSYYWATNAAFQPGGAMEPLTYDRQYNNQQKDAIIRNTYRLFNAQQNLHTIFVVAQGINDQGEIGTWDGEDVDTITGEKRAVAVVWRDPFPRNGTCEMLVRQFKYLDE